MGCSQGDKECGDNEQPAHEVTITRGFWIGQTEVTQEAYQRVMNGQNPSRFKGARLPVETISWNDADAYCRAIGGRLPTEAEWEYAARAGSTDGRYGDVDQIAWYGKNSGNKTHEVAGKAPNTWGLYDTLGNVWEWTADGTRTNCRRRRQTRRGRPRVNTGRCGAVRGTSILRSRARRTGTGTSQTTGASTSGSGAWRIYSLNSFSFSLYRRRSRRAKIFWAWIESLCHTASVVAVKEQCRRRRGAVRGTTIQRTRASNRNRNDNLNNNNGVRCVGDAGMPVGASCESRPGERHRPGVPGPHPGIRALVLASAL